MYAQIPLRPHPACAHAALLSHSPGRETRGGFRISTTRGLCDRFRCTSARNRTPAITGPFVTKLPVCNRTTISALLRAQGCCVSKIKLTRPRSHAARNRNHVAIGIRHATSGAVLPRSSTIALNPPFCNTRSVARNA
jgi:hypothetical protein